MTRTITNPGFSPKDTREIVMLAFNFVNLTAAPLTPVVTVTRHAGTADASPSAILLGVPLVVDAEVRQQVQAGVTGTDYLITCEVDDADGNHYVLAGVMPVRAA